MDVATPAEQLFFVTARLEGRVAERTWVGTGFVHAVKTNAGSAHFLITNKHVVADAESMTVTMIAGGSERPHLGHATQITLRAFGDGYWAGHPDPAVDVAAFPLSPVINEMVRLGGDPFFRSIPPDLLASADSLAQLDALEEVVFVGYPAGLFDSHNLTPVARRGMTASPVSLNYQGLPAFLVDAAVYPGSSGSPVFIHDRGAHTPKAGGLVLGSRLMCLGILAAVHVRQVQGNVEKLPTGLAVTFDDPLGLGIVFKAETFEECIDLLLARAGLTRLGGEPPEGNGEPSQADEQLAESGDAPNSDT